MAFIEMLESRVLLAALPPVTSVALDGAWQLQRTNAADIASLGATWTSVQVPSLTSWNDQRYAWYRADINVASNWAGGRVFLSFGAVRYVSDVYVNGIRVGGHFGGWEPFDIDITSRVTPGGTDQVLVRVQDMRGVLIDPNVPYTPQNTPADGSGSNVLAPVGSQEHLFGIWEPVKLEYRRDVFIRDVAITTSVANSRIDALYTLQNLGTTSKQVTLDGLVLDGGLTALGLGSTTVTVAAGSTLNVTLSQPWANPKLWQISSPQLYYLQSNVSEASGPLDTDSTRFGFREFKVQGTQFYLNGTPLNFLATAGHPDWSGHLATDDEVRAAFAGIRSANAMAMRLHANIWSSNWYRIADEIGLPIILESAIWCDAGAYALDQPAFWQNARDHWAGVIGAHRNNPSVVMYSIENELLHVGGNRVPTTEVNLGDLGRYVKSLDPTRPIMFDGDEDPDGAADVVNLHYPWEFPNHLDYPNTADWLPGPVQVEGWPYQSWQWDRAKPLYMGEFLWMFEQSSSGYTGVLGDSAYTDDATRRAKAAVWEFQIEAYRKAGVAGIDPWTLWESGTLPNPISDVVKRAFEPNAAIVDEYDMRFFSGQAVTRTVQLYNDTRSAANLTLEWWLGGVKQGQSLFSMAPAGHIQTQITLTMPSVAALTTTTFQLVVRNGANTVYTRDRSYEVYPSTPGALNLPGGTRVAVFSGDGTANQFLQQSGVTPLPLADLALVGSLNPTLLIIDAHALDSYSLSSTPTVGGGVAAALQNYMRSGGSIIVLEQNALPAGLFPVQLTSAPTTIGFMRETTHPALTGLRSDAMQFWRGDNYVSQKVLGKPSTGGFRVLVDAGDRRGLERALVLELLQGQGRCILSQALVSGKKASEPMAGELLARLIRYAATASAQRSQVGVVDADGSIAADLDALGADYRNLTGQLATASLAGLSLILVDARSAEVSTQQAKLKAFVQAGGTVLLHGADAAAMAALGASVPGNLTVIPSTTTPVLMRSVTDPVSAGMMHENLHWLSGLATSWDQMHPLANDVLLGEIMRTPPAVTDCSVIEAESMTPPPSGTGNVSGGEVLLWTNASIQTSITLASTGTYYFAVYGHGSESLGEFPSVSIYLDDQFVGSVRVNAATAAYGVMAQATAGTHTLRLAFTNDTWDPANNTDRNVWIDKFLYKSMPAGPEVSLMQPGGLVRVNDGTGKWVVDEVNWDGRIGTQSLPSRYLESLLDNLNALFHVDDSITVPAADLQKIAGGTAWNLGSDGVLGLWANATWGRDVNFVRGGTYRITLDVMGTLAGGAYGIGRLLVDGVLIGSSNPTSANWQQYSFDVNVTAGVHTVAVEFANDYYNPPTEDRNLSVRKFQIRPVSLTNAAPTDIALTGTSVAENLPAGTVIGIVSGTDPDAADLGALGFSLVSGYGDNAQFMLDPVTRQLKTAASFNYEARSSYSIKIRATDTGNPALTYDEVFNVTVTNVVENATIAGRRIFYNRSYFDGNNVAPNASDDSAIATDKAALLPGQKATFANYTSYSRGINGLMVDITGAPGVLAADDLVFKVGNSNTPTSWTTAPAPSSVTRRAGAGTGGSDRYTIIFTDNAVAKKWLQITVLANTDTGLSAADVFYFGNAIGESGNTTSNAYVNSTDELGARNNPRGVTNRAPITFRWDYNRDSLVNATDESIVRSNKTGASNGLKLITVPLSGGALLLRDTTLAAPSSKSRSSLWSDTTIASAAAFDLSLDLLGPAKPVTAARSQAVGERLVFRAKTS
jgi:hypothetical protein